MRILLVLACSRTDHLRRKNPFMPLSLPLLAAVAPGHEYTLVDLFWDDEVDTKMEVDLVGISARVSGEARAYELADAFRRRGVTVVLGGPQISAVPLRARLHADAVVVGEGEPLWPAIVADAQAGALKDFYVCAPGTFVPPQGHTVHQLRALPPLDEVPFARRDLFRRRYAFETVFSVRGCPIDCDFCSVPRLFGRQYRTRRPEAVAREIDTLGTHYYLIDDTVFGKPATYDHYLELYGRLAEHKRRRFWVGQGNLDAVADEKGREVIRAAVRAGLTYAMVGMESVSPATLTASGAARKMGLQGATAPTERMAEHVRWLQEQGVVVSGWFVLGYESDTLETWEATARFCEANDIIPVIVPVTALHGTRLRERLEREGKLDDTRFLNFRHPTMRDEDVLDAWARVGREGYTLERCWKRTRAYARRFGGDAQSRVHKTIFTWVLQMKMRSDLFHRESYEQLIGGPRLLSGF